MLRLTLAQMRRSLGRLTGAGIAIVAGTAFLAATLLAGAVMDRTMVETIGARYADADLVVSETDLDKEDVDAIRAVPGVDAADAIASQMWQVDSNGVQSYEFFTPTTSDLALQPFTLAEGDWPTAEDTVALPPTLAHRLDVTVGDTITVNREVMDTEASDGGYSEMPTALTVTGIIEDPYGAYSSYGGASLLNATTYDTWEVDSGFTYPTQEVIVATDTTSAATIEAISAVVPDATVRTTEDQATETAAQLTGEQDVFTAVILAFAAVALLVAALVIANTFQVLVAQRTRTLALLRCVGADRSMLARSVLLEAAILGLIASAVGIAVGAGLVQGALLVAGNYDLGVPLPATISFSPSVIIVPLIVGTLVTLAAAWSPARAAMRVAPLEALRPRPALEKGASRTRAILSGLLVVSGTAALVGGIVLGQAEQIGPGLLLGIFGGALSFIGLLLGAVLWLPRVAAGIGALAARISPTAHLAVANTLRNPRRTTATSSALLIGVTLVAMMTTGTASARVSLDAELDKTYPVEIDIQSETPMLTADGQLPSEQSTTLTDADVETVAAIDGVADVLPLAGVSTMIPGSGDEMFVTRILGIDPADAPAVVQTPEVFSGLVDGELLVNAWALSPTTEDGDTVTVTGADGPVDLTMRFADVPVGMDSAAFVTPTTLASIAPAPTVNLWVNITNDADQAMVVAEVKDAVGDQAQVLSPIAERETMQSALNAMLAAVIGLLAVAIIIAMVGVANTLSLSVLERRRENATLRAIGLSRVQLRWMLATEGVLIAFVGAVAGCVIGLLYGWAGAATVLSIMGDVALVVPWRDLAIVLAVSVFAGLIASVVPGRTAARTSPVEALAVD